MPGTSPGTDVEKRALERLRLALRLRVGAGRRRNPAASRHASRDARQRHSPAGRRPWRRPGRGPGNGSASGRPHLRARRWRDRPGRRGWSHLQRKADAPGGFFHRQAELVGRALALHEHVDAHDLAALRHRHDRRGVDLGHGDSGGIRDRRDRFQRRDHGVGRTRSWTQPLRRRDRRGHRSAPCRPSTAKSARSTAWASAGLADVAQHHRGREQHRGGIGDVLARRCPAPSRGRPRTSRRARRYWRGATPRPPTRPAARSLRMSPNRLVVTSTSSFSGLITIWCAALSTIRWSCLDVRILRRDGLEAALHQAFAELHDVGLGDHGDALAPRLFATSKASRMIQSQPFWVTIFRLCATPGVCMCSMPA